MAITHLILVGSLKFQRIWLQGENLHWFLPKKNMKNDHLTKIDQKSFFRKNKFSTKQTFQRKKLLKAKETFQWNKLFEETNFSTKQTFWRWNKLFDKTSFLVKQTFRQNKLSDETYFFMKHTFWQNFFNETNFITYLLLWLLKSEIFDRLIFRIVQKFSIPFNVCYSKGYDCNFSWKC